jgi:hypothetical protein
MPTPVGTPATSPSPAPPGVPSPPIDSAEEALAAVAALDSNFLGYRPRDPDLIGQSSWVDVRQTGTGYELTFFRGAGDCPAGCITRSYVKFSVGRDGRVEKRCEWREGEGQTGTPC